ncbi:MAG: FAD-dependent oxidoreductase [Planctomycetes bacterium]|nr:FAD-dependent oxidoreductase [Planctomycetota bacterium]
MSVTNDRVGSAGRPRVVVLGGGPAGLGGAWQLALQKKASVTLVEQNPWFGGNAGSFEWEGQKLDFGSHRLHPACEPSILADLKQLLGADLLDRPRHGRIRLLGRFIHFPLKPLDLLTRLPPSFGVSLAYDGATKRLRRPAPGTPDTFESVLSQNLGPTMCDRFYFPYARKIWGRGPEQLSGIQARRRVSAGTVLKLVRKVLNAVPGFKKPGSGRFWYPRHGYGQLSDALARAAQSSGAELLLEHRVKSLQAPRGDAPWRIAIDRGGRESVLEADHVWSTLPVTLVPKLLTEPPPAPVFAAAAQVSYRAMLLVYLRLPVAQFTEYDAHYFPEAEITITRLSEPKNYGDLGAPAGATTLCAELPCDAGDRFWKMSEAELGAVVAADLARAGLPLPAPPTAVKVMRLPQAYPIYLNGYEQPLEQVDRFCDTLPRFLTYGRQGLFAHDNTHHALAMAWAAVDCLTGAEFDRAAWAKHRAVFATHVVED